MLRGLKQYSTVIRQHLIQRCSISSTGKVTSTAPQAQPKPVRDDKFIPNKKYDGFVCQDAKYISDFNMTIYMFEHEAVRSRYMHIDRNDSNNLFAIGFRTTPYDSTGLPHILEHITLCGSEKYPVRDPFFKMLTRSVATFMNAFTGPDYTLYPFSSMNETDFRNLQMIYLDAVFKPNLRYLDFLQEGWRLENTDLTNSDSDYLIKGVVYNEMKGSYSEVSNYFVTKFLNSILPDHTYQHCSGGDPLVIPQLTYQNLVDFQRKYYHPSNARFFSYGNFDPCPSMKYVNDAYLSRFKAADDSFSAIPLQKRWTKEKYVSIPCRFDNMGAPIEKQNQIAIGYVLSDIQNVYETLLLNVICELLVKGPNSRFYKNLIEPNLSGGYSPVTGFESTLRDTMFVVGLQDVDVKDFEKIQKLFDQTIDEVVEEGFDTEHIEGVLNNIELSLKHQSPKFGLSLLMNVLPIWMHGGNAIDSLKYSELICEIRQNLQENPKYLQEKVKEYFQDNQHKLTMTVVPNVEYEKNIIEAEEKLIKEKAKQLTKTTKEKLFNDCKELAKIQQLKENVNVLPCLKLSDVERPPAAYKLQEIKIENVPTQICAIDTNHVTYMKGLFNASRLNEDQKKLLPLLANVVDQMGTKSMDYRTFDKRINLYTSGLAFHPIVATNVNDLSEYQVGFAFATHCLEQNTSKMFDLIHELLDGFNFEDVGRFEMLLNNYQSALSVGVINSGHLFAMQSARGLISDVQNLKAHMEGIEHIEFIKNLVKTTSPAEVLEQLKEIASILFRESHFKAALNTSPATENECIAEYSKFLQKSSFKTDAELNAWTESNVHPSQNKHNPMTIPVNYCAKAIQAVPFNHVDFSPLRVLGKILSAKYLLPIIREQNGAYGAGAAIDENGIFSYFSYRDPNTVNTLNTFDLSARWINENWKSIDEQALFEAKLGLLQKIDDPIGPGSKGAQYFKLGLSQKILSKHRQSVLAVKQDDLKRVVETYLNDSTLPTGRFVLGPENTTLKESWQQ